MNYTKGEREVLSMLDFNTPNVGYEDEQKQDVCGCCGTYYVVSPNELANAQEVMKEMYEALKAIKEEPNFGLPGHLYKKVFNALAKAEGK